MFFFMSAFSLGANKKKENYAAVLRRSLLSFFEEHPLNCLHCSVNIILAIQLAKKVPDAYYQNVMHYSAYRGIFKAESGPSEPLRNNVRGPLCQIGDILLL